MAEDRPWRDRVGFEVVHGAYRPRYAYWTKVLLRKGWLDYGTAFK